MPIYDDFLVFSETRRFRDIQYVRFVRHLAVGFGSAVQTLIIVLDANDMYIIIVMYEYCNYLL